jgi:transposase
MPPTDQIIQEYPLLKAENAALRAQIDWLKKQLFGGGKSERLDRAQLALQLGELEQQLVAAPAVQQVSYERSAPVARVLPAENFADLPVQETVEIIPAEVRAEPAAYERIGEERSFEIDVVPPQLVKREIIRPKYRHKADRSRPPVVAPAPVRPVAGGYASAGLLAWVTLSKDVDHQPLYRQEQMSERWGARISRQSMADWIARVADWLQPLYRQMHRELLAGDYVQCDETPIRCNDPDEKRGGTSQGWLWVISRPGSDVVFDWRLSRRQGEATSLLDGFRGVLQSDAYPAYANFAREHEGVAVVGCWAHARRRFHEALKEAPKPAGFVLRRIGQLYHLEQTWDEAGWTDPVRRAELRQRDFARPLALLHKVTKHLAGRARPRSLLGGACHYLLAQWPVLTAHTRFGQTRLDTNLVENSIRPTKLGAKNWLFIGHPDAGDRSAIIYSIVISCKRHGIEPLAYLRDVLTRLPTMTNQDDLRPLLPSHWSPPA